MPTSNVKEFPENTLGIFGEYYYHYPRMTRRDNAEN